MNTIKLGGNQIFFGENALEGLRNLESMKKKAFIIMSGDILEKVGSLKKVTDVLDEEGFRWMTYSEVEPEPSFKTVMKGTKILNEFEPDWIIGFGGGSAMDAAKAMWVFYENPEITKLEDIAAPNEIPKLKLKARICCIPTSAGTGSEATRAALIKDTEKKRKYSIRCMNGRLNPDIAILDPLFTLTMPKNLTSTSGMDALTHAIEAFVTPISNPFSDSMAIASFIYGYENLLICYTDGNNIQARSNMLAASCMGGIAFSNSALGITHSIAHAFGAEFNVPHGLANAITLAYDIEYNQDHSETVTRYAKLARFVGVDSLLDAIRTLTQSLDIPKQMKDVVKDDAAFEASIDTLVEKAMADVCTRFAPKNPSLEEMRMLICKVYYGE